MDCKLNMLRYFCTVRRNKLKKLKILIFMTNQALIVILRNEKRNPKIAEALAKHLPPLFPLENLRSLT